MKRSGFGIAESMISLVILSIVLVLIATTVVWSLEQRSRLLIRQSALEQAENALEEALATPWPQLTAEWAGMRKLSRADDLPDDAKLLVRVEPYLSNFKRVTATVAWEAKGLPESVALVGIVGESAIEKKEESK